MKDYENVKELVLNNEALIYSIAKKFSGDIEDLFQVGVIGLIKAKETYKPEFNTKFSTHAYPYIFGEIYQYVLHNKNIRISSEQAKLNTAINKAYDYLCQKFGREPTDMELANFLEVPIDKIFDAKNIMNIASLDDETNEVDLYNFIPSSFDNKDDLIILRDALNKLNNAEKELILKRYYFNMTQSEIAKEFGTNQVKVSREEGKVLTKLRSYM